jgi:hypothetical protein
MGGCVPGKVGKDYVVLSARGHPRGEEGGGFRDQASGIIDTILGGGRWPLSYLPLFVILIVCMWIRGVGFQLKLD